MKIIDNPALGIGLLLCIGLAVFGIAIMSTAGGQSQVGIMVTSDEATFAVASMTSSDDFDDSPFLTREAPSPRPHAVTQPERPRVEQARAQDAVAQQSQRQQGFVRIDAPPVVRSWVENPSADPFIVQYHDLPRDQQRGQQVVNMQVVRDQSAVRQQAEKRDELLFRIVELRLQRGEFEKIAPVVIQMQNPEKAIEAMLDFAEESTDDENIEQLLDVATTVTLQMGQSRPPVAGVPSGMGGPGMPGMMPMGMPPGHPMPVMPMAPSGESYR